jgi:hypothetical protein
MASDRSIRRLTDLADSASTARVLNLVATHRRSDEEAGLAEAPFFQNRLLDRSIILKHRLRQNEYALFDKPKSSVTKILLPIDTNDLKAGAHAFFVGQRDFEALAKDVFGEDLKAGSRDRQVLELIDSLPSLDPFLLRESLRSNGIEPARAYFGISDADVQRMFDFVRGEVMALVALSSGGAQGTQAHASRLVEKLLSSAPDSGFEPLKVTLKLNDKEYQDGVFAWRGFLYYKWVLGDLRAPAEQVIKEIVHITGRGPKSQEASDYIPEAKKRIAETVRATVASVEAMLDVYNTAYASLTKDSNPNGFRDFLLSAPAMFASLGEQLGAVQHIHSFWRYRFPADRPRLIAPDELMDVFLDFEDSLVFSTPKSASNWAA